MGTELRLRAGERGSHRPRQFAREVQAVRPDVRPVWSLREPRAPLLPRKVAKAPRVTLETWGAEATSHRYLLLLYVVQLPNRWQLR